MNRISSRWAAFVGHRPITVLVVAAVLAAGAVVLAVAKLELRPNRNDLISQHHPWNRRFIDWRSSFAGSSDVLIVIDTGAPNGATDRADALRPLIETLAGTLATDPNVTDVSWGASASDFSPKAARLLPLDRLQARLDQLDDARALLESEGVGALLDRSTADLQASAGGEAAVDEAVAGIDRLTLLIDAVDDLLVDPDSRKGFRRLDELAGGAPDGWRFLTSPNERFALIRVTPAVTEGAMDALGAAIAAIRSIVESARRTAPGFDIGITGVEVVESDETTAATRDATISSILAAVLISTLLLLAFRGWRTPAMLMGSLAVGIAWSFGFLVLSVGYLQLLSVVFVVVLLGLGVDFGIHLVTSFESADSRRPDGPEAFDRALESVLHRTGPGIVTGAVTTAAAFAMTATTNFRGVVELGIIAAGGVLLCLLATLTVLPAMLRLLGSHLHSGDLTARGGRMLFHEEWILPVTRRPVATLLLATIIVLPAAFAASSLRYDFDLLALQPDGMESVQWQSRLQRDGDVSVWFGVSLAADLDEARRLARDFGALPTVGHVGGIGLLVAGEGKETRAALDEARERLGPTLDAVRPDATPEPSGIPERLVGLRAAAAVAARRPDLPDPVAFALRRLDESVGFSLSNLSMIDVGERDDRLGLVEAAFARYRQDTAERIETMLDAAPPGPSDLPAALLRQYIEQSDGDAPRYVVEAHPRASADPSIAGPLDPRFLPAFVDDLRSVDPDVTGVIMQIYYSGDLISRSFLQAGLLALAAVSVLLLIVLRSVHDTLLCLVPVACGFAVTFGVMALTGVTLNAANIIVLPLMFGIGVDAGVHVVHRYRHSPHDRPIGLSHGTGRGVALTALTTIIGFASMLIASHRGIRGIGFVMALGMTLTLIACWTVVPAWLELKERRVERAEN